MTNKTFLEVQALYRQKKKITIDDIAKRLNITKEKATIYLLWVLHKGN